MLTNIYGKIVQIVITISLMISMMAIFRHAFGTRTVDVGVGVEVEQVAKPEFRIIVITATRPTSLQTLLTSLQNLETDGDTVALDIWIDRGLKGDVNNMSLRVATQFKWTKGATTVHVQPSHAGIYGQWIDTWRPEEDNKEIALILEDDLSVSPYAYRWLKAAHAHYGRRTDIAGYTLQTENVNKAGAGGELVKPPGHVAFLYKLVGSWGFSPHPQTWRKFRTWFHTARKNENFHPYVPGLKMTNWYKTFEKKGTADNMWTMWFIYFCNEENVYTLYNNIQQVSKLRGSACLAQHRQEPGLHYSGKGSMPVKQAKQLLMTWDDNYIRFSKNTIRYEFDGKTI